MSNFDGICSSYNVKPITGFSPKNTDQSDLIALKDTVIILETLDDLLIILQDNKKIFKNGTISREGSLIYAGFKIRADKELTASKRSLTILEETMKQIDLFLKGQNVGADRMERLVSDLALFTRMKRLAKKMHDQVNKMKCIPPKGKKEIPKKSCLSTNEAKAYQKIENSLSSNADPETESILQTIIGSLQEAYRNILKNKLSKRILKHSKFPKQKLNIKSGENNVRTINALKTIAASICQRNIKVVMPKPKPKPEPKPEPKPVPKPEPKPAPKPKEPSFWERLRLNVNPQLSYGHGERINYPRILGVNYPKRPVLIAKRESGLLFDGTGDIGYFKNDYYVKLKGTYNILYVPNKESTEDRPYAMGRAGIEAGGQTSENTFLKGSLNYHTEYLANAEINQFHPEQEGFSQDLSFSWEFKPNWKLRVNEELFLGRGLIDLQKGSDFLAALYADAGVAYASGSHEVYAKGIGALQHLGEADGFGGGGLGYNYFSDASTFNVEVDYLHPIGLSGKVGGSHSGTRFGGGADFYISGDVKESQNLQLAGQAYVNINFIDFGGPKNRHTFGVKGFFGGGAEVMAETKWNIGGGIALYISEAKIKEEKNSGSNNK